MGNVANSSAQAERVASWLNWLSSWLLLVPEAALLAALLALYPVLGKPLAIAILAALLITIFVVRALALHFARLMIEVGRYRDAGALLGIALILYPWSADAIAMSGALALSKRKPEEAEEKLQHAIRLLPTQPSFHIALSSALLELGRAGEAAKAARHALSLDHSSAQAYLYLAEAERVRGALPHAIEEYLRTGLSIVQRPELCAALQCALAHHLIAEHRFAEASLVLRGVEALLSICPPQRQAELRYHLGELFTAQGQIERAREHFQGVEALDPHGRYATAAWRAAHLS